jgi:TonB family protein
MGVDLNPELQRLLRLIARELSFMNMRHTQLHFFKSAHLVCSMVVVLACAGFVIAQSKTSEWGIRNSATKAPKPVYPKTAIDKGITGVVVASLFIRPDGRMETVVILEAPDPSLATAVREAVNQWTFQPDPWKNSVTGRLTFYFRIVNGMGRVLEPKEMPGSRWPKPPAPSGAKAQKSTKAKILQPIPDALIHFINKNELNCQLASTHPIILDISERDAFRRGHVEGAVNIPFDELGERAPIELPPARPIIIDCSREGIWCQNAGNIVGFLQYSGFSKLTVYR